MIAERERQHAAAGEAAAAKRAASRAAQQDLAAAKAQLQDARARANDGQRTLQRCAPLANPHVPSHMQRTATHGPAVSRRQQKELDTLDASQPEAPDAAGDEVATWAAEIRELDAKLDRLRPEADAAAMQVRPCRQRGEKGGMTLR